MITLTDKAESKLKQLNNAVLDRLGGKTKKKVNLKRESRINNGQSFMNEKENVKNI